MHVIIFCMMTFIHLYKKMNSKILLILCPYSPSPSLQPPCLSQQLLHGSVLFCVCHPSHESGKWDRDTEPRLLLLCCLTQLVAGTAETL